jgi:hypothetical protein
MSLWLHLTTQKDLSLQTERSDSPSSAGGNNCLLLYSYCGAGTKKHRNFWGQNGNNYSLGGMLCVERGGVEDDDDCGGERIFWRERLVGTPDRRMRVIQTELYNVEGIKVAQKWHKWHKLRRLEATPRRCFISGYTARNKVMFRLYNGCILLTNSNPAGLLSKRFLKMMY